MTRQSKSHLVVHSGTSNRPTARVHVAPNLQGSISDTLNLKSAEVRNDITPLPNCGEADTQRPRDIRGALKVIKNVLFEHKEPYTVVKTVLQPQYSTAALTSVAMDKRLQTLADRLNEAMGDKITSSELARACRVSPAAVGKWRDGQTKTLKAENYRDAARALGVREEWLRDGKLPRERDGAEEESQVDQVLDLLEGLQGPLSALVVAIEKISKMRPEAAKHRKKA